MATDRRQVISKLTTFLKGSGKALLLVAMTALLTYLGGTFIALPMPSNYIDKAAFASLVQTQKGDVARLEAAKLNKEEYERRHQDLRETITAKLDAIEKTSQGTQKMLGKLIDLHMHNK
jgi:hypothetical protein